MSCKNPRFSTPDGPVLGWQWQTTAQGQPYLTCELLGLWPHGFFTQQFAPQTPTDLAPILGGSSQRAYRLKQVHGPIVFTPQEIEAFRGEGFPDGDGLVTEEPGASVWVASADCTPVLVGDRTTGQVAAIHSGWRGTAQGATGAAVARLLAQGSQLEDLVFALGPAIAGEVYQVTTQVGEQVAASLQVCQGLTGDEAIALLQAQPDPPLFPDPQPGRVRLDVRQVIRRQLTELGVEEKGVAIAPCCTYQQPDYFFSYRRTHAKNVQWSGILSIAPRG
ncbi:peptidoglycan editing factor PgeF [Spirulina sp. CCNP1310]|uniref:peptidoglycan editing factor PgeF n=1 Tax=Spirulina sp. CCNP1310 TaxID=3110249 RepID=UPI002B1F10E1|nr:peptidoglycan editing factor PgeF [Spirulina sp. CCNP1310]MEA5418634.1 peptidoglycan editing factor PgeF [Spirulina sp. CCNP1310]